MGIPADRHGPPEYTFDRFLWMMANAARWKCPTCGKRSIFVPWHEVRSLQDWFMPLDGCPNCGYPFEREPGYFLLSIFAINYGAGAFLGLFIYLLLDFWLRLPILVVLTLTIIPIPIFNLFFARHSKAFFLAFDLFFDPHHGGDDGGDQRRVPSVLPPKRPSLEPLSGIRPRK
jgi:predicted RNA-binding Zn-ribbon protein involved in translation (DUF1610 family)